MGQEVKKEQKGRKKSKKIYKIIVLHYFFHGVTIFFSFYMNILDFIMRSLWIITTSF